MIVFSNMLFPTSLWITRLTYINMMINFIFYFINSFNKTNSCFIILRIKTIFSTGLSCLIIKFRVPR
nr:MAG TPA: hypothetical protein [Caudoviricetes sp.]